MSEPIKVGDKMIVRRHCFGGGASIETVDKVYKRYFVCGGLKWNKEGFMRCIGGTRWSRPSISRATPDDEVKIAAAERRRDVMDYEWRTADQATIDAVHLLISARRTAPNPEVCGPAPLMPTGEKPDAAGSGSTALMDADDQSERKQ